MHYALRGIALVYGSEKLRGYAFRPMIWAVAAYLLLAAIGFWLLVPWISDRLSAWKPLGFEGFGLGATLFVIAWVFLSGAIFVGLAGWLSSLLWDGLSLEVELRSGATPHSRGLGCAASLGDAVLRLAFSGVLTLLGFLIGLFTFGIGTVLVSGWIGCMDFTSCACARRGLALPRQITSCASLQGAKGFALACGLCSLAPVANVFLLPGLVAGGTLLILDAEKSGELKGAGT